MTRKLYIRFFLGREVLKPVLTLFDSGSDLNIFSLSHLKSIYFDDWDNLKEHIQPSDISASSFTNDKIHLAGSIELFIKLFPTDDLRRIKFYLLPEGAETSCPIIMGIKSFVGLGLELSFNKINGMNRSNVIKVVSPTFIWRLKSFYITDTEKNTASVKLVNVTPGKIEKVKFFIHKATDLLEKCEVLTSDADNLPTGKMSANIKIISSKSIVEFCSETQRLYCYGTVFNDSLNKFSGPITVQVESLSESDTIPINEDTINKIAQHKILCDVDTTGSQSNYNGYLFGDCEVDLISSPKCTVSFVKFSHSNISTTEPIIKTHVNLIDKIKFPVQDLNKDPTAINNNVASLDKSLTEERYPIKLNEPLNDEEMSKFYDKKESIFLGMEDISDKDLKTYISEPRGYTVPDELGLKPEECINFEGLDPKTEEKVREIFCVKYPNVVSTNEMDIGNLSLTMGRYKLQLRDGAKLPKTRKVYYLAPSESSHMRDILDLMLKKNIIAKSPNINTDLHSFACSSFVVPRKNKQKIGRLVIDYSLLNPLLLLEPPIIPHMDQLLHEMRDDAFFSCIDVSQAFCSLEISDETKYLTAFTTPFSIYYFNTLPTGAAPSPGILQRTMNKIVHFKVGRDKEGKLIFEKTGVVQLNSAPIKGARVFFDDVILGTKYAGNIDKSRDLHFEILDELISRFNDHSAKLNLRKSQFFKVRINFLGFNIQNNFITPDKARIQKVLDFEMPETTKGFRCLVGICNSLRLTLGFSIIQEVTVLMPLCSDKGGTKKIILPEHHEALANIKKKLTSAPIFSKIINPFAPKIVFSDASSASDGCFSAVVCQVISAKERKNAPPGYLDLNNPCHSIILERDILCIPTSYSKPNETYKDYISRVNPDYPPEYEFLTEDYRGLTKETFNNSLNMTLETLFLIHCMTKPLVDYGEKCLKKISTGLRRLEIKEFVCQNNNDYFDRYKRELSEGYFTIDTELYIIDILAEVLMRGIMVIDGRQTDPNLKVREYNIKAGRPTFHILILDCKHGIYCRPAYLDRNEQYALSQNRGQIEIIAYYNKKIPQDVLKCHILDLENWAILTALYAVRKYIGNSECLLLSDSKGLVQLFNNKVLEASTKLSRWHSKLIDSYPTLKIGFCSSENNLSDFLSKTFNVKAFNTTPLQLPVFMNDKFFEEIDGKIFSLDGLTQWVNDRAESHILTLPPEHKLRLIKYEQLIKPSYMIKNNAHVLALTRTQAMKNPELLNTNLKDCVKNALPVLEPFESLKKYLTAENIVKFQKIELKELYNEVLTSIDLNFEGKNEKFFIKDSMLYRENKNRTQIMLPPSLLKYLIVQQHLTKGHLGFHKLILNTDNYYCPQKRKYIEKFCMECLPCALVNQPKYKYKLSYYPAPEAPFESVHVDFIESLPYTSIKKGIKQNGHLVVFLDLLTGAIFLYPINKKTPEEFLQCFLFGIYQTFRPSELVTDNAPAFVSNETTSLLQSYGVGVTHTASMSPHSRGNVEQKVGHSKSVLKKMLATCENYNWLFLPPALTLMHNTSVQTRHNMEPFSMIFGKDSRMAQSVWSTLDRKVVVHPACKNNQNEIDRLTKDVKEACKSAANLLDKNREKITKKANKNRKNSKFTIDDIVFIKNKEVIPGSTLPLKTNYVNSPFIILEIKNTCAICMRLADGKILRLNYNYLKKFSPLDKFFSGLPKDVESVITQATDKYTHNDMSILINNDEFFIPSEAVVIDPLIQSPLIDDVEEDLDPIPTQIDYTDHAINLMA